MATDDRAAIAGAFVAIQNETDRDSLRTWPIDINTSGKTAAQLRQMVMDTAAFGADLQKSLGLIYAMATAGRALVEQEPVPVPTPPPTPQPPPVTTTLQGFGGTYSGHGAARDLYLGPDAETGEWGRHWGWDVLAPAAGRVEAYSFPTPLQISRAPGLQADYEANHHDLFDIHDESDTHGFVCYTLFGAQAMSIAVFWPDQPIRLSNGQMCKAMWFGHCRPDILVGRVAQGGRVCTSWNSGIDFERDGIPALASHIHVCGSATGTLSPNGDIDGFLVAAALGWKVRDVGVVPGPTDYQSGMYRAGKPLGAWAGRQLPPPPS